MNVTRLLLEPTQSWKYFSCAPEVSESIIFTRRTTMKRESLKKAIVWVLLSTPWFICNLDRQPLCNWTVIVSINPFVIVRSLYVKPGILLEKAVSHHICDCISFFILFIPQGTIILGLLSISTCELKYYETLDSCIILHHWMALKWEPGEEGRRNPGNSLASFWQPFRIC